MNQNLTTHSKTTSEFWSSLVSTENQDQLFLSGESNYTYANLISDIKKTTSLFRNHNLTNEDSVLLITAHEYFCPQIFLSCYFNGICTVILDPEAKSEFIKTVIQQTKPKLIFCDAEASEVGLLTDIPLLVIKKKSLKKGSLLGKLLGSSSKQQTDTSFQGILEQHISSEPSLSTENAKAYVLYTSGTTSSPKGVVITQASLNAHLTTLSNYYEYASTDKILNILPYHHVDGFIQGPILCAFNHSTLVRPFTYSISKTDEIFTIIRLNRISHFITVPTLLSLLYPFYEDEGNVFSYPEFKFIVSAAGKLETKLWDNFQKKYSVRIANLFGLTETVTGSLYCGPNNERFRLGSIGKPVDCKVKIINEQSEEITETGVIGELCIRGSHVMLGYLNNPDATTEILKDNWLHTGDLVRKDEEGFYWLTGRKKSVIIRGGINIYPEELSEILNTIPNISESCTVGIEDELWGEKVVSCVVFENAESFSTDSIYEMLRKKLPSEKIPNEIITLSELPKGPSGKIQINAVKQLLDSKLLSRKTVDNPGDISERLMHIAADIFKVPVQKLSPASSPENTPGWDSLGHMSLVSAVEKNFKVKLSMKDIMKMERLEHFITFLSNNTK